MWVWAKSHVAFIKNQNMSGRTQTFLVDQKAQAICFGLTKTLNVIFFFVLLIGFMFNFINV